MQSLLWDRRIVLAILDAIGVPTPPRLVVSRDGGVQVDPEAARAFQNINHGMNLQCIIEKYTTNTEHVQVSKEGTVQVGNVVLKKPFLEKPVNSEDHNINIYLNNEQGGGGRHLFRKVRLLRYSYLKTHLVHLNRLETSQVSLMQTLIFPLPKGLGFMNPSFSQKIAKMSRSIP